MNAVDRRKRDYASHRAFLENVTGMRFGEPYLDPTKGVVFHAEGWVNTDDEQCVLYVRSIITDVKDFAS